MLPNEQEEARKDAEKTAVAFGTLLLSAYSKRDGRETNKITFSRGRFYVGGRPVAASTIRSYLITIQTKGAAELVLLNDKLERGEITISEWHKAFERRLKVYHILAAALVIGGITVSTKAVGVNKRIDEQLSFAFDFSRELARRQTIPRTAFSTLLGLRDTNKIPPIQFSGITIKKIRARAKGYLQAVHLTFVNTELEFMQLTGFRAEARNILTPAEHCSDSKARIDKRGRFHPARPGCPELTERGWMPTEDMVPLGHRTCTIWCKCFIEYR
jgi:hypothetical protein